MRPQTASLATLWLPLFLCACATCSAQVFDQNELAVTPIPADPRELVTGRIEALTTPKDVSAAFALLDRAKRNMDLYYDPQLEYTLKVSFTAGGPLRGGAGNMEEIKGTGTQERWSARMGDYSIVRVNSNRTSYDEKTPGPIPLRIHMLRAALLWPFINVQPRDHARTTSANWNGKRLECVLLSEGAQTAPVTRGRSWREQEFCIDAKTGLLQIHSQAPGIYAVYDFQDAIHFQTLTVPRGVTIFEAGTKTLDARIDSIAKLDGASDAFTLSGSAVTPGAILSIPMHHYSIPKMLAGVTVRGPVSKVQPVVVHASLTDDGDVLEAEVLQDPASEISKLALAQAKGWHFGRPQGRDLTVRQWEVFAEVDVLPPGSP